VSRGHAAPGPAPVVTPPPPPAPVSRPRPRPPPPSARSAKRLKKLAKQGALTREPKFGPRATAALKKPDRPNKMAAVEDEVTSAPTDGEKRVGGGPARPTRKASGVDVYANRVGQEMRGAPK